jgi:hypothetical protein
MLVRRVFCRGINLILNLRKWGGAELIIKQVGRQHSDELLEERRRIDWKAAE